MFIFSMILAIFKQFQKVQFNLFISFSLTNWNESRTCNRYQKILRMDSERFLGRNLKLKPADTVKYRWNKIFVRKLKDLQIYICTSLTLIDAARKQIKLQRSAWWQIEAFLMCYPTTTKRFIFWKKIIS